MVVNYAPKVNLNLFFYFNRLFALLFFIMMTCLHTIYSQTTLINPVIDGSFSGSNLSSNNWSVVSNTTDRWVSGTAIGGTSAAYVSNDGSNWNYSQNNAYSHLFYTFSVPANQSSLTLTFDWQSGGEGTGIIDTDNMKVFVVPANYSIPTSTPVAAGKQIMGTDRESFDGQYKLNTGVWNPNSINFSLIPGESYKLVFSWKTNASIIGTPPSPAAIKNVSLISNIATTIETAQTGNWNDIATWVGGVIPNGHNNVKINLNHTVTINKKFAYCNNLENNGTINFFNSTSVSKFLDIGGNLTNNANGVLLAFAIPLTGSPTSGREILVSGNIINNGKIDISVGTVVGAIGKLTLNGAKVQTVSGTGIWGEPLNTTTTIANRNNLIRTLNLQNYNSAIPNILWNVNNIIVNTLEMFSGKMNLNGNKIQIGNYAVGTLTLGTLGNYGFLPNSKISRWFTTTTTGSTFNGSIDSSTPEYSSIPSSITGRYPFIDPIGNDRSFYVSRTSAVATGNTAGALAVTYNHSTNITTGLSINDNSYFVNNRYDGNWAISAENGYVYSSGTHAIAAFSDNAFVSNASPSQTRLTRISSVIGKHFGASNLPMSKRSELTTADLTQEAFYLGVSNANTSYITIGSGNWNNPAVWNNNNVPTCSDVVVINTGHTISVNSDLDVASAKISVNAIVNLTAGSLNVGCNGYNNTLKNLGTLNVSGGALRIRGSLINEFDSSFNQTGGDVVVDGNDFGVTTSSVPSTEPIVAFNSSTLNLNAGNFTIVDPHADNKESLIFSASSNVNASPNHTFNFGDDLSIDGGSAAMFKIKTNALAGRLSFGNVSVKNLNGTNRTLVFADNVGINGDLIISATSKLEDNGNTIYLGKNLINNGEYFSTGKLYLGKYTSGIESATIDNQTISGSGTFSNELMSPNASLKNLTVNNISSTGITLLKPISISENLELIAGDIKTSATNLLSLGTTTNIGSLIVPGSAIPGKVIGPFKRSLAPNTTNNFILFPVGNSTYSPIYIAPESAGITQYTVESFDSNSGTSEAGLSNLSSKRWEVKIISGSITNFKARIGNTPIVSNDIVVQAPTANGVYSKVFGGQMTFSAASSTGPAQIETVNSISNAQFTGFFAYAKAVNCSGTPTPGTASATNSTICNSGSTVISSVGYSAGTGITYLWQSSTSLAFTSPVNIGSASSVYSNLTTPTLSVTTYYRLVVTCTLSSTTSNSNVVTVTVSSVATPTGTSPQIISSGTLGMVSQIVATPSAGSTLTWYANSADAIAGTNPLSGSSTLVDGSTYYGVSVLGTCRSAALPVTVMVVLENNQFELDSLLVAPNPASNDFTINYTKDITSIQLYDLSGRLVRDIKPNTSNVKVYVQDLSPAVYILKLESDSERAEMKIIKK